MNKDIELRRAKFLVRSSELEEEIDKTKEAVATELNQNERYLEAKTAFDKVYAEEIEPLALKSRLAIKELKDHKENSENVWKVTRTTDSHDGYSWCDYDVTEYLECEICGKKDSRTYTHKYRSI